MKPLTLKETKLKEEMKNNCLKGGKYKDEKAKDKFKMLCHLEDFEVKYWELQQENQELKKQLEKYEKQLKPNYYVKGLEGTLKEYQQEMNKVAIQQKKFINWLEENYKITQDICYIKILQKYKSIIGVSDENTIK